MGAFLDADYDVCFRIACSEIIWTATADKIFFFNLLFSKFGAATPKLHKHIAKRNTDAIKKVIANILAPIELVELIGVATGGGGQRGQLAPPNRRSGPR